MLNHGFISIPANSIWIEAEFLDHLSQQRPTHDLLLNRIQPLFDVGPYEGFHIVFRDFLAFNEDQGAGTIALRPHNTQNAASPDTSEENGKDKPFSPENQVPVIVKCK